MEDTDELTSSKVLEFKELFDLFDTNNSNTINSN